MSDSNPSTPKRRVTVRMTARDKSDPAALLAAVRNALACQGISLVVRTADTQMAAVIAPQAPVVRDEVLETKARELAGTVLDAARAKADKEAACDRRDAARSEAEIVAQRAGLRAQIKHWIGQGFRITVEGYVKVVGAVKVTADVVTRAFGGESGKAD